MRGRSRHSRKGEVVSTYQILSLIVSPGVALIVGAAQVWVVLRGINAMKEASEIRDRAHERRHQETMAAIKSQHNEAMEAIDRRHREAMTAIDRRHEETMAALNSQHKALETLIERTAPA